MNYSSTRNSSLKVSSAEAILTGLAPDGGLFVPASFPKLDFEALAGKPYSEIAFNILRLFLTDYDEGFLRNAVTEVYGERFDGKAGHLEALSDDLYALELWHGPTCAFKDYALQLMPLLLVEARRMLGEQDETIILVATSGDTGSAALAGYSNVNSVKIAVFYPNNGTSLLQQLQMTTQTGKNVAVYGVTGNFDDAQRGVKRAFTDPALAEKLAARGAKLSSANSINWGRLVPQIVYYATSYLALCQKGRIKYGQPLDFCVPTGNFGDIMAGWYAKQMGLPVGKLICASNKNNVLAEFLETGQYNANREFYKTSSPSMDILVSSNLERLLCHASGSTEKVTGWMAELARDGSYQVDATVLEAIQATFEAGWCSEEAVFDEIRQAKQSYGYLSDPHTAVALRVAAEKGKGADGRPVVVLSTASPYKFSCQVLEALKQPVPDDEFDALRALEAFSGVKAPESLSKLVDKPVRFTEVIDPASISEISLKM
ncbi:threonine synthase [Ruminococcaceae bacterium OttesenSCG-928-D13]|nr:threonine synthase [Ruminococcaceae bacterium OttesenSCG-928-D13]